MTLMSVTDPPHWKGARRETGFTHLVCPLIMIEWIVTKAPLGSDLSLASAWKIDGKMLGFCVLAILSGWLKETCNILLVLAAIITITILCHSVMGSWTIQNWMHGCVFFRITSRQNHGKKKPEMYLSPTQLDLLCVLASIKLFLCWPPQH